MENKINYIPQPTSPEQLSQAQKVEKVKSIDWKITVLKKQVEANDREITFLYQLREKFLESLPEELQKKLINEQ